MIMGSPPPRYLVPCTPQLRTITGQACADLNPWGHVSGANLGHPEHDHFHTVGEQVAGQVTGPVLSANHRGADLFAVTPVRGDRVEITSGQHQGEQGFLVSDPEVLYSDDPGPRVKVRPDEAHRDHGDFVWTPLAEHVRRTDEDRYATLDAMQAAEDAARLEGRDHVRVGDTATWPLSGDDDDTPRHALDKRLERIALGAAGIVARYSPDAAAELYGSPTRAGESTGRHALTERTPVTDEPQPCPGGHPCPDPENHVDGGVCVPATPTPVSTDPSHALPAYSWAQAQQDRGRELGATGQVNRGFVGELLYDTASGVLPDDYVTQNVPEILRRLDAAMRERVDEHESLHAVVRHLDGTVDKAHRLAGRADRRVQGALDRLAELDAQQWPMPGEVLELDDTPRPADPWRVLTAVSAAVVAGAVLLAALAYLFQVLL